ncbi:MAG: hypothetical protein GX442_24240 [Candidatus Riflebacteria bacterium]|nr:hypothetical protein [Candidatus Riflebacteria bacterium]
MKNPRSAGRLRVPPCRVLVGTPEQRIRRLVGARITPAGRALELGRHLLEEALLNPPADLLKDDAFEPFHADLRRAQAAIEAGALLVSDLGEQVAAIEEAEIR